MLGHSLGSVVAYETVALDDLPLDALVTAGSPLAIKTVRRRLRAEVTVGAGSGAGSVPRWVNVFDPADPVACAGPLSRLWAELADFTVGNGDRPHDIERYLNKKILGKTLAASIG